MRTTTTSALLAGGLMVLAACSTTVEGGAPPEPASTAVTITLPPVTEPPVTEPPVTEPPVTEPPVTEPPTTVTVPETVATTTTLPMTRIEVAPMNPPLAAIGTSSGSEASRLQERLLETGFWVQGVDGRYGLTTRQAVMAVQKYAGLSATGSLDTATAEFLSAMTHKAHGRTDAGTVVEVDKTRQLLFFVVDGVTEWVLNTSTGTEVPYEKPNSNDPSIIERGSSVTPVGLHQVNRQRAEGWWEGDLGQIYRPKYFIGGVAVHGSNSIPNYPASHGCVRVSVPAMDWIWDSDLMPMNSPVWVYGEIPRR